ncbi:MAG: BTAD domain-containing putative transcriptional regulator [Dehalococcoidia bacterium]|nr:BTAD domain-containing putative transcriptional regulator [Dehalococcoidia bacterium]
MASFVIDRDQRILLWSDAAGELLRIAGDDAIGLDCASAVGGRNASGDAVCRLDCRAFRATRAGATGRASPMVADHGGGGVSLNCSVVALSGQDGRALVTLAEDSSEDTLRSRVTSESTANTPNDLVDVVSFTASIGADIASSGVQHTLDWIRQTLDVEAAELFLREPGTDDMLLSSVRSPFESAFTQINRFRAGQGFPGLVFTRSAAVHTTDLSADERYLRTRVKAAGFVSYLCVPLRGSDGILGTLNIAARRPDVNLVQAQSILELASVPLAAALESTSLRARLDAVPQPTPNGIEVELEALSRHLLQTMMSVGGAATGELIVYNPDLRGTAHRFTIGGVEDALCRDIQDPANLACPALVERHGIALNGQRTEWPSPCQHLPATTGFTHCIPLVAESEYVGIARLQYHGTVPSPPTNHLALLLAIATQAAPSLRQARDTASRSVAVDIPPNKAGVANGHLDSPRIDDASPEKIDEPFLNIRCFGSFELYRNGPLLPPDAVQRRGALVLLKILLVNDGRPVSRDMLIETLWPGTDPSIAANRLYVLIHALRRAIEPTSQRYKRRWTFICNDGDRYYISPDAPYRCDVRDFRQAVELGGRQERNGDWRSAVNSYSAAIDLYTGDLFEDDPYAEWCWVERENLRETVLDIAVKIGSQHDKWDAPDESVVYYQRALRIDPLREQVHRRLIEALLAAGRRSDAQRQYSVCIDLLRRELGIEPMPETRRLQRMIFAELP